MNERLAKMISEASNRIGAADDAEKAGRQRRDDEEQEKDYQKFRRAVEMTLGLEVIEAIGPVEFRKNFLAQQMTFEQDGQSFRLRQETGTLVQLEKSTDNWFSSKTLAHQFNLNNSNARDFFLTALGAALCKR
jgi:hypothetical protein